MLQWIREDLDPFVKTEELYGSMMFHPTVG